MAIHSGRSWDRIKLVQETMISWYFLFSSGEIRSGLKKKTFDSSLP